MDIQPISPLMLRMCGRGGSLDWTELVAGYDFSLLGHEEIRRWIRAQGAKGEAALRLLALEGEDLLDFEQHLWEACTEAMGRVPRPGERCWAEAQDRWRRALLDEALEADLTEAALAQTIESIYERVGCPDDMLALWVRRSPWQGRAERVDFQALRRFLGTGGARVPAAA